MWRCVTLVDGQALVAGQVCGDDASRLYRAARKAVELEVLLDDEVGVLEGSLRRRITQMRSVSDIAVQVRVRQRAVMGQ